MYLNTEREGEEGVWTHVLAATVGVDEVDGGGDGGDDDDADG